MDLDDAPASDRAARSHKAGLDQAEEEEVGAGLNAQLRDAMSENDGSLPAKLGEGDDADHDDLGEGTSASGSDSASSHESESATEEDEEPTLRYSRIQSQPLTELFSRGDTCSSLAVSSKYLVLGTHNGGVVIMTRPGHAGNNAAAAASTSITPGHAKDSSTMSSASQENGDEEDLEGQKVLKRYKPHQASVMDIVIDEESHFVGTASTDGELNVELLCNVHLTYTRHYRQGSHTECGKLGRPDA